MFVCNKKLIAFRKKMKSVLLFSFMLYSIMAYTQETDSVKRTSFTERLTLDDVITLASQRSIDAILYRHQFLAAYWQYRSFRAELLPSLNLGLTLPNFNHALVALQNAENGEYNYVQEYSMRNSINLSIDQNIAPTGGKVSVYSSLERLDQFEPQRYHLYNSNPVSITYTQPIFGSFNQLKWDKKIEPEAYEKAKMDYLEGMESVRVKAVELFFNLVIAQQKLNMAKTNFANTENSYQIAQERFKIGTVTQNDLMQLELRMLNDGLSISQNEIDVKNARFQLASFLGYSQTEVNFDLIIPEDIPELTLNYSDIYNLSVNNTSFKLNKKIQLLRAEMAVAQAKSNRGAKADFFAQFGLNQSADKLGASYRNSQDQENIRLGIQFPIIDWGMGRGRVKTAQSQMNVIKTEIEQELIDQQQDIMIRVLQFNNQHTQCQIARKANEVALKRYELSLEQFSKGTLSVLEFNTAQTEKDEAVSRFITEIQNYWKYYYSLQKSTLYNFKEKRNISTDFDQMVQN